LSRIMIVGRRRGLVAEDPFLHFAVQTCCQCCEDKQRGLDKADDSIDCVSYIRMPADGSGLVCAVGKGGRRLRSLSARPRQLVGLMVCGWQARQGLPLSDSVIEERGQDDPKQKGARQSKAALFVCWLAGGLSIHAPRVQSQDRSSQRV
jgi:hypothetical protein